MLPPEKSISFCITSRNRLWQLEQTLAQNIAKLDDGHEICLVDYGSSDGLSNWIWGNFSGWIESGKLTLFEVRDEVTWHVSRAKNLAHRIASGRYLFNLDADNFITARDIRNISRACHAGIPAHQFSGTFGDGSYGRIGCPRDLFFRMGGYDETLLPMGGQDVDLLNRLTAASHRYVKFPPPRKGAIKNTMDHKVREIQTNIDDAKAFYDNMNTLNIHRSNHRLLVEGPIRSDEFATFRGLLNGRPVVIDGLNRLSAEIHVATAD